MPPDRIPAVHRWARSGRLSLPPWSAARRLRWEEWMSHASSRSGSTVFTALRGSTAGLELEGRADVDRLAVAVRIGQRRDLVAFDLIADAPGQGDVAADVVGAADIQRHAIRTGQRNNPILVAL